jgi:methylmalonyl-CoA mutase N-terminal domain/subunit
MGDKLKKAGQDYMEKLKRLKTWSGFAVKEKYTPEDVKNIDYQTDIADPGQYPFTRGIYADMYRGKLWTRRQPWGFGTPEDTNEQLKFLIEHGNTGLMVFRDQPTMHGIDSDHPLARGEVGVSGVPLCSVEDMEDLMDGIPLEKVSMTLLCASVVSPVVMAQYLVVAKRRGIDPAVLRGTISNDSIMSHVCYSKEANPINLGIKVWGDLVEYCAKNMPLWHAAYVSAPYNIRDSGIDAPQEIAFGLAIAATYIDGTLRRGMDIDDVARRMSFYCNTGIDLFEEVAKFRAMRRMWARMLREKYGARDPRSWQFKFAVQCAGSSLVPQQPLNNIARTAFEALAAVLGGAQSVFCTTYTEPISLPTKEAQRTALGIQGIIAYETGAALVADPLGGSYYVEALTDKLEEEAGKIMAEIENMGGFSKALESGWVDKQVEEGNIRYQKEIESGERLIVGVNTMTIPPEEDSTPPGGVLRIPPETEQKQIARVKRLKETRDQSQVKKTLENLREESGKGEGENLMPAVMEAVEAYATVEEIMGTIREAYGLSWDPWGIRKSPF